jgi:hypothetical protein
MAAVAISSVLVFEIVIEDTLWQPQAHRGRHTGDPRVFAQLLRQAGVDPADATVYAQTLSDERYSQAQFNELTAEDLRQLGFALGDTARVQKLQRQPLGNLQALPTVEAEAGRLAAEEAEADASGHTAADHMSAEQGVASASQSVRQSANAAEVEQVAPEKAEQEQSAAEKAEVERLAEQVAGSPSSPPPPSAPSSVSMVPAKVPDLKNGFFYPSSGIPGRDPKAVPFAKQPAPLTSDTRPECASALCGGLLGGGPANSPDDWILGQQNKLTKDPAAKHRLIVLLGSSPDRMAVKDGAVALSCCR